MALYRYYKFVDALSSSSSGVLKCFEVLTTLFKTCNILMLNIYFLFVWKMVGAGAGPGAVLTRITSKQWKLWAAYVRMLEIVCGLVTQSMLLRVLTRKYEMAGGSPAKNKKSRGELEQEDESPRDPSPRDPSRRAAAIFKRR